MRRLGADHGKKWMNCLPHWSICKRPSSVDHQLRLNVSNVNAKDQSMKRDIVCLCLIRKMTFDLNTMMQENLDDAICG